MKKIVRIILIFGVTHLIFNHCQKQDDASVLQKPYLAQNPPGRIPEVFAPGKVSTEKYSETGCTFTRDGKEFYFTRTKGGLAEPTIFVSRFENSGWTDPEQVMFKGYGPHISPNGKRMLVTKRRQINDRERTLDIWILQRTDEAWNESQNLGPGARASMSRNGTLYFIDRSSEADRGVIAMREFVDGSYRESKIVGGGVNSPFYDAHPCIAADESYIIFDSDRPGGQGWGDLYICFRDENGVWGEAINLGDKINTSGGNICASLSPDGKYVFYLANRDIYWVDAKIIEELNPDFIK